MKTEFCLGMKEVKSEKIFIFCLKFNIWFNAVRCGFFFWAAGNDYFSHRSFSWLTNQLFGP